MRATPTSLRDLVDQRRRRHRAGPRFDARVWKRRQQPVSKKNSAAIPTRTQSFRLVRDARRPEDGGPPVPPFTGFGGTARSFYP